MRVYEPWLTDQVDDEAALGLDVRERVLGALALGDGEGDGAGGDVEEARRWGEVWELRREGRG